MATRLMDTATVAIYCKNSTANGRGTYNKLPSPQSVNLGPDGQVLHNEQFLVRITLPRRQKLQLLDGRKDQCSTLPSK